MESELSENEWDDLFNEEKTAEKPEKPSFIRRLFNFTVYLIFILLLAIALPTILSWVLGTPYPMATITSQSMWPVLKKGDLVFLKKVKPNEIKKGQIIVYRRENILVIHRVIKRETNTIVTKGDANTEADNPIEFNKVIGAIPIIRGHLVKIPYLGRITFMVKSRSPLGAEK